MESKAYIKDNHLYLEYEWYSIEVMGYRQERKIIPVKDIKEIEYKVGPKGGNHGWEINGEVDGEEKTFDSFGKKNGDLLWKVIEVLEPLGVKVTEIKSDGSGPCF